MATKLTENLAEEASKFKSFRIILTEDDIPGASLQNRKPESLKNEELKRWLKCRGGSVGGNRVQLLERIRDSITSGLDKKVIDPDGGIHYRRLRAEKVNNSSNGHALEANCRVQWPEDSWSLCLVDLPEFQHCYIFSYLSGGSKEGEKRRGAFKCKREGYALFKAYHVQDVKYNFSSHKDFCFFETKVKASMTRNKTYRTKVSLRKNTAEVDGAYCNCKAGANGYCKHVGAVLYTILDFVESGFEEIPPNKSCTEKPQEWHKPRRQNPKNTTVYFNDMLMIRHDYEADKNNKTYKQMKRKNEKQSYSACPSFALKVTSEQIHKFCCDIRGNSDESKPMICDLLEGNDYKPVIVKDLENEIAKCNVLMDHDYEMGT